MKIEVETAVNGFIIEIDEELRYVAKNETEVSKILGDQLVESLKGCEGEKFVFDIKASEE